jgi:replicative DNA helicase
MVVGAETGVGKSYFTLGALLAASAVGPTAYVSLEDPLLEVGRRLDAHARAGADIGTTLVACPDSARLGALLELLEAPELRGAALVGVDYLQLVGYDVGVAAWSKADAVSRTVTELKSAAKRGGYPLILVSQLRRSAAGEAGQFPSLGRLKESGDIENQAEFVVMLGANARGVRAELLKAKAAPAGAMARYRRGAGGVLVPTATDDEEA